MWAAIRSSCRERLGLRALEVDRRDTRARVQHDAAAFEFAANTGMRRGEVLGYKGNREGEVQCLHCGSVGFCAIGPAVLVYPDGVWYAHVTPADVPEIIESHLKGGVPVERLVRKRLG